ncbi:hypothetical protein BV898_18223 [Hypsibius exemplaris]|uniref:Intradiol ring-cleavage dioxygenases domain-containing protein n=1 Tax=Hypsibius exemplaris TaxID=2072580 RepID=A0A9X6NH81_HYPEX|nr:hypothetical protein BV898_18223 [Hypsibius exemplaris]
MIEDLVCCLVVLFVSVRTVRSQDFVSCFPGAPGCFVLDRVGLASYDPKGPFTCSQRSGACMTTQCVEEGPYYKTNAPIQMIGEGRNGFTPQICPNSVSNDRLIMNGTVRVVDANNPCGRPTRAMLDVWHADPEGNYTDIRPSAGDYKCRTRLITGDSGFYTYSTTMPGRYASPALGPGFRAVHVHVKVTPLDSNNKPIGRTLTLQQYFALDMYMGKNDVCTECRSDDPTLITHLQHSYDIKTFDGVHDILLAAIF